MKSRALHLCGPQQTTELLHLFRRPRTTVFERAFYGSKGRVKKMIDFF